MRTIGVDLAAEAANTAIAVIDWHPGRARVVHVEIPADDTAVLRQATRAAKVGIDCPLGWPDAFVTFVHEHRDAAADVADHRAGAEWRRSLAYRRTDERVRSALGMIPLSVATDRIGLTAMRAARLQVLLAREGHPVGRDGSGLIVEVYPAAGLKHWQLAHRGYKGRKRLASLGALVDDLRAAAPWLDLGSHEHLLQRNDHALDATVAAMLAYAADRGLTIAPADNERASARTEGWIALPACTLDELRP